MNQSSKFALLGMIAALISTCSCENVSEIVENETEPSPREAIAQNCSAYSSCTQCVSSQCDWCVEAHKCTHDTAVNCDNDILISGTTVSLSTKPKCSLE